MKIYKKSLVIGLMAVLILPVLPAFTIDNGLINSSTAVVLALGDAGDGDGAGGGPDGGGDGSETNNGIGNPGTGGCCGTTGGGLGNPGDGDGAGSQPDGPDAPEPPDRNEPNEPNPPQNPPTPRCILFEVTPSTLPVGGGDVTVRWKTQNAAAGSINQGIGGVSPIAEGSVTVRVTKVGVTNFVMSLSGAGGTSANCSDSVRVPGPPVDTVPKCVSFLVNGKSHVSLPEGGGTVTLTWNVRNANRVTINNGVGQFSNNVTSTTVNVTRDTTFILTATDADNDQDTCSVTVKVKEKEDDKRARCDFFTASPTRVEPGDSVRLEWGTTNVSSVSINRGVGSNLPADGGITVQAPNDEGSFTYTLSASNNVNTDDCEVTIYIEDDNNGGGGGGSSRPRCELKISARTIDRGDRVTLSWETSRADEVTIFEGDEDDGRRIFRTRDDDEVEDGRITVRPNRDTTYTLVAEKGSRDDICRVKVNVDKDDDVVVLSDRFQTPIVKGITLTQVPYTGFDAGPTLTFIFYALLALWGAFVAYFYIYRRQPKKMVAAAPTYGEATREEFEKKVRRLTDLYTGRNLM